MLKYSTKPYLPAVLDGIYCFLKIGKASAIAENKEENDFLIKLEKARFIGNLKFFMSWGDNDIYESAVKIIKEFLPWVEIENSSVKED